MVSIGSNFIYNFFYILLFQVKLKKSFFKSPEEIYFDGS